MTSFSLAPCPGGLFLFTYHIQYIYIYSFRARGEDNIGLDRAYTQLENQRDEFEKILNTQKQKLESTMANESTVSDSFVGSENYGMFSYKTHYTVLDPYIHQITNQSIY